MVLGFNDTFFFFFFFCFVVRFYLLGLSQKVLSANQHFLPRALKFFLTIFVSLYLCVCSCFFFKCLLLFEAQFVTSDHFEFIMLFDKVFSVSSCQKYSNVSLFCAMYFNFAI